MPSALIKSAYRTLCTEYYDLERPAAPEPVLQSYRRYAAEAQGAILEPMCGTGRFLIPLLEEGYAIEGFDNSPHMIEKCRQKCAAKGLSCNLLEASFETCTLPGPYDLIFIPSGSFCHLTDPKKALEFIYSRLSPKGKFVVEIETLEAVREPQGVWKGNWVVKPDGATIVRHVLTRFDPASRIEKALFIYELWVNDALAKSEVEEFYLKLYDGEEIEQLFKAAQLKITGKQEMGALILYECQKNENRDLPPA